MCHDKTGKNRPTVYLKCACYATVLQICTYNLGKHLIDQISVTNTKKLIVYVGNRNRFVDNDALLNVLSGMKSGYTNLVYTNFKTYY